jgi:hypothetical protein
VIDGQHTWKLWSQDSFGNPSEPIEQEVFALQKDNWEAYECGGVRLGINQTAIQRGFTDLSPGAPDRDPNVSSYLEEIRKGECDPSSDRFSLTILKKGHMLPCYPCGGNFIDAGILLSRVNPNELINDLDDKESYIVDRKNYVNNFGVEGELVTLDLPVDSDTMMPKLDRTTWFFVFEQGDYKYYLRGERWDGNETWPDFEKDYMNTVDNFTLV